MRLLRVGETLISEVDGEGAENEFSLSCSIWLSAQHASFSACGPRLRCARECRRVTSDYAVHLAVAADAADAHVSQVGLGLGSLSRHDFFVNLPRGHALTHRSTTCMHAPAR